LNSKKNVGSQALPLYKIPDDMESKPIPVDTYLPHTRKDMSQQMLLGKSILPDDVWRTLFYRINVHP
jgi:hypothetical protein